MSESKRPVGRPYELNEQVIEQALEYVKGGYKTQGNVVPTVAGLAVYLCKSRAMMYEWAKQNNEFSDILETLASIQEMLLVDGGLIGDFNSTIAKMMMTKHGYSDKVETNHTSTDGSMTPKAALSKEDIKAALQSGIGKI